MSEFWNAIAGLAAVFGAIWLYGSSAEDSRTRFKSWIRGKVAATSPLLKRMLWRGIGWAAAVGCVAIVVYSSWRVYGFLHSTAPMSRHEVFNLLLNSFNGFMYLLVGAACWGLLFRNRNSVEQSDEHRLLLEESQGFALVIAEESDHQLAIEKIKNGEVRFRIARIADGKVHLSLELPEGLSASRV